MGLHFSADRHGLRVIRSLLPNQLKNESMKKKKKSLFFFTLKFSLDFILKDSVRNLAKS